ncbi:MAG: phosphoserine phosphatase SerB [Planctomycetes bacterium]|nr:phosphoserine phosphatase SerB [Planctomycetota bacterium]
MTASAPSPAVLAVWRSAQAVCFDVDSTVSPDEGIDVLAAHAGVGAEVAELTRAAMGGAVLFEDALRERLAIIEPTRALLESCLAAHPPRLTPGIGTLVAALRRRGTQVYLISGGFVQMITPLARALGLDDAHVIANRFVFAADGSCIGVDEACPTARSGGKGVAIAQLTVQHGSRPLVMIGDGVTDLEARPPADLFIGYGGVVVREKVRAAADWYVMDFADLIASLQA